jgi:excisionase family DNA binding protein
MGFLTTSQAAERLGVTDARVRQLIREKRLPAEQYGRAFLIKEGDLRLVADRKVGRPRKAGGAKASKKRGKR